MSLSRVMRAAALAGAAAATVAAGGSGVVALVDVNVIDGTGAPARAHQTLLVESGRIREVGDAAGVAVPPGATAIDLAGHSVLPGLVSLHDHVMNQHQSAPKLFLAFGVTTLRTAGASEPYADLNLKARIDSGRVPGPELFVTSPFFNHGDGHGNAPFMKQVTDPDGGQSAIRYWAAEGVTSIKVYRGITPALLRPIVEEAHRVGLPVLGHLEKTSCRDAALAGIDSIEHAFGSCAADFGDPEAARTADPTSPAAQALIRTLVEHKVTMTPTPPDLRPAGPEELAVMHPGMRAEYDRRRASHTLGPGYTPDDDEAQVMPGLEVAFVRAGGRLGLGADCTPTNVTRVPGFANIKAVKLLYSVKGFSRLEAISIATLRGAEILGIADRTGSITKGKEADLLIVKGDPSRRTADLDKVAMVFSNGVRYDPTALIASVRGLYGRP